jgi:DNA (cytosine-5)-methyltransferase 1
MAEYTFLDLFSGAGGFTEGFLLAGTANSRFRLVGASDIHRHAQLTHVNRFRKQLKIDYPFLLADMSKKDFTQRLLSLLSPHVKKLNVDIIIGGPPCQGFALFGKRNEDDPRNNLFQHYLNVITQLRPKYFVMENVPGLTLMYQGKTVNKIHELVSKMGPTKYGINGPIMINAAWYGIPQLRERVIFIGHRNDMRPINTIPKGSNGRFLSAKEAIGDLAFLKPWESTGEYNKKYRAVTPYQRESRKGRLFTKLKIEQEQHILTNHEAARHSPDVIARFAVMEPGKGLDSVPRNLWNAYLSSSKKWCVRLDPKKPSFTIVTLPDDFVHYQQPRILTVREMARLQSFDDTFEFLGPRSTGGGGRGNKKRNQELPQYTQVGNAVPPLMARAIGDLILRALEDQVDST